jgi:DNA polymerase (family X)
MPPERVSNQEISSLLTRIADLLEAKGENPFRIRSYRTAASTVAGVRQSLAGVVRDQGVEGLSGLKGVGEKLAGLIREYVETGTVQLLQELEKEVPPAELKKVESKRADHAVSRPIEVPVDIILEVDAEYRRKVAEGKLKKVAPRLLNPEKKAWLPILATEHRGLKFTVMFSNTPTAHKLGKTDDWVVVYAQKGKGESQCTVVTKSRGSLKGKRVIRGREKECGRFYGE